MVALTLEQFIESEEWTGKEGRLPDGSYRSTYDSIGGCWNIGPGLTHGITRTTVMTRQQIDDTFLKELKPFEDEVHKLIKVPLTNNQFIALVSFAYNCGEGELIDSPIVTLINNRQYSLVPSHLKLYVHGRATGSKIIPGLVNRRNAEIKLWNTPDDPPLQAETYVAEYDSSHPVPKGAAILAKNMITTDSLVTVPLNATTAIIPQLGHKVATVSQGFFLTFLAYALQHFNSLWDLIGINSLPVYGCTAIIALIEWYKHSWVNNSNATTTAIIDSLESKLKEVEAGKKV